MGYDVTRCPVEVDAELICSICQGVLEAPKLTECGHMFCTLCINQWLCSNPTCPMDRKSLTIAELKPDVEQNILDQLSGLEIRCENNGCSATLPLFNITKHVKEDCEHKPVHMLLSAGEGTAAEKYGDIFGLYISEGTQAFKQLHDVNTTVPFKLYKDRKGNWVVGDGDAIYLWNVDKETETVPEYGWMIFKNGEWSVVASIRCCVVDISQALCGNIKLSATGAARIQADSMGEFQPTGQFSAGRQIFINQRTGNYLFVCPDYKGWGVGPRLNDADVMGLGHNVISFYEHGLCPAMRRTGVNIRYSRGRLMPWQYWDGMWYRNGNIKAECSVHSH